MMRLLAAMVLCVAVAACSGGKSHGGDTPSGPFGGTVTLQRSPALPYALGFFVSSAGEFSAPVLDSCLIASTAAQPAARYLDAGATLTISGGSAPISLPRVGDASYLYYSAYPAASAVPFDTVFDLDASGGPDIAATSWPGVLEVRHAISLPGSVSVPATGDLALSWTPVGADFVRIEFLSGVSFPALLTCVAKDDGSFSVPAADLAALPSGSGNGLLFAATIENAQDVGGRIVAFDGVAASETNWSK